MKVLFVCEYNACRSQMAEALARTMLPAHCFVMSAGVHPGELNQDTVEVMREIGIDMSSQYSKQLAAVRAEKFDLMIVLADPAWEHASGIQAIRAELWHFPDPVAEPASVEATKEKIRRVRDALALRIRTVAEGM